MLCFGKLHLRNIWSTSYLRNEKSDGKESKNLSSCLGCDITRVLVSWWVGKESSDDVTEDACLYVFPGEFLIDQKKRYA